MISILPGDLARALSRIRAAVAGTLHEGSVYLVGGALRDALLGRPHGNEIDLVVEGDALALAQALYERKVADLRPVTYPRFGTAMTRIEGVNVELVTARRESYEEASRKPEVEPATIEEDALRRDFTINTLMMRVHDGDWIDSTGWGMPDLSEGRLRTPLDPDQTFYDDPLRMLRAVRFSAQLGFRIDPLAMAAIRRSSFRLAVISQERIREEWSKLLCSSRAAPALAVLQRLGLLSRILPELSIAAPKNAPVWRLSSDTLAALLARSSLVARLAAVLSQVCGTGDCITPLQRLRYSRSEAAEVALLLELRRWTAEFGSRCPSDGEIRRLVRRAGDLLAELFSLCSAGRDAGDPAMTGVDLRQLKRRIQDLEYAAPSSPLDSPLDGLEIMRLLGIGPGPEVRRAKEWLLEEVLQGRLDPRDRPAAVRRLLEMFKAGGQWPSEAVGGDE